MGGALSSLGDSIVPSTSRQGPTQIDSRRSLFLPNRHIAQPVADRNVRIRGVTPGVLDAVRERAPLFSRSAHRRALLGSVPAHDDPAILSLRSGSTRSFRESQWK